MTFQMPRSSGRMGGDYVRPARAGIQWADIWEPIQVADETQAVLDGVRRIVHALRESSRRSEQRFGLSGAQLFVLQKLSESQPASVNDLAARTHTHQSSVSTVVSRLVAGGFVRRLRSAADARQVELSLTPKGRRLASRDPDVAQERLVAAIARLPVSRRRALASSLSALAAAVHRGPETPAMFFEEKARRRDG